MGLFTMSGMCGIDSRALSGRGESIVHLPRAAHSALPGAVFWRLVEPQRCALGRIRTVCNPERWRHHLRTESLA